MKYQHEMPLLPLIQVNRAMRGHAAQKNAPANAPGQ
jgi:hypothetical protein